MTTRAWAAASSQHGPVGRGDDPDVPDGGVDAVGGQLVRRLFGRFHHLAHGQETDDAVAPVDQAGREAPTDPFGRDAAGRCLREADDRGAGQGQGRVEHGRHLFGRGGGEDGHARDGQGQGEVEDAVVAGTVVTGDAGPVEGEDDREAVEADVQVGLVEGPGEEGRVDGHHRAESGHGHAGGGGDGVLLGDADVEEAVGVGGLEGEEAGGTGHGRRDGEDLLAALGGGQDGGGEGVGVGRGGRRRLWGWTLKSWRRWTSSSSAGP